MMLQKDQAPPINFKKVEISQEARNGYKLVRNSTLNENTIAQFDSYAL